MIYTVFFKSEDDYLLPQDFSTYKQAEEAAKEAIASGLAESYEISSTDGEVI